VPKQHGAEWMSLVNNAGWTVPGFIATDTDRHKWQRTVEINLFTAIAATQAAIPAMKEAGGGAIVFIASDAAFGQIRTAVYGASKAAMVALARTTARDTAVTASDPTSCARAW
jgi:2-hydroxycyclohexanecarboxyl-CoA dehydrogenase